MRNKSVYRPKKIKKPMPEGVKIAIKWVVYCVFAFLFFAFSTQGTSGTSRAIILFPLAFAIAVFESEVPAAVTGAITGLLIDISLDKLLGFTAFFLCIACGLISAFFRQFLRKNIINYLVILIVLSALFLYIDYYLFYRIWGYEGFERVLKAVLVPSWLKTLLWSPAVFGGVWLTDRLSGASRRLIIEEQDKNIDRV